MKVPPDSFGMPKCVSAKPSLLINSQKLNAKRYLSVLSTLQWVHENDLETHVDFKEWRYYNKDNAVNIQSFSSDKPLVYLGSFQDLLGKDEFGNIKLRMSGFMR